MSWITLIHVSLRSKTLNCAVKVEDKQKIVARRTSDYNHSEYVRYDDETDDDDDNFKLEHIEMKRALYEQQFKEFPNHQGADKYLVYMCEKDCGGLADRVKGMKHVYMLSVLARRRFAIHWGGPCQLHTIWEPNLLNWTYDKRIINELSAKQLDYKNPYQAMKFKFESEDLDPEVYFKDHDVIMMKSNQDWTTTLRRLSVSPERFPEMYQHSSSDLTRIIFHGLFKYSKQFNDSIYTFFKTHVQGSKLACFHARMGVRELPSYKIGDFGSVFDLLESLRNSRRSNYKIMVASDSEEVKAHARNLFAGDFVDTSGPLVHIDIFPDTPEQHCAGFSRVFLDLAILSRCDTLILTYSGFGMLASFLRHTSHDLYSFFNTHGPFPVSRENSKKMYQYRCLASGVSYLDLCPP